MQKIKNSLLVDVANYYAAKLGIHGASPQGVDWNGEAGQVLRFEQLFKLLPNNCRFSLNDLGCGYGALHDFLTAKSLSFSYLGIDVSDNMIDVAKKRFQHENQARFIVSSEPDQIADYSIASGIFNVCMRYAKDDWQFYIETVLDVMNINSRYGFAFNCLTSYSDKNKMRDDLYYADPCLFFDLCKRKYSSNVALIHDYGLYEFTILVRKSL